MIESKDLIKNSFKFLHRLYELSGGFEYDRLNVILLGKELGFDERLTEDVVKNLHEKGMIELQGLGGVIIITPIAIRELEVALSHPDQPTLNFPSVADMFTYQHTIKAHVIVQ